jgi:hypothetical protein
MSTTTKRPPRACRRPGPCAALVRLTALLRGAEALAERLAEAVQAKRLRGPIWPDDCHPTCWDGGDVGEQLITLAYTLHLHADLFVNEMALDAQKDAEALAGRLVADAKRQLARLPDGNGRGRKATA